MVQCRSQRTRFCFWVFYVCANFGENRSRNATVRVRIHRHTDTDTNRHLFVHTICYNYGADNKNVATFWDTLYISIQGSLLVKINKSHAKVHTNTYRRYNCIHFSLRSDVNFRIHRIHRSQQHHQILMA